MPNPTHISSLLTARRRPHQSFLPSIFDSSSNTATKSPEPELDSSIISAIPPGASDRSFLQGLDFDFDLQHAPSNFLTASPSSSLDLGGPGRETRSKMAPRILRRRVSQNSVAGSDETAHEGIGRYHERVSSPGDSTEEGYPAIVTAAKATVVSPASSRSHYGSAAGSFESGSGYGEGHRPEVMSIGQAQRKRRERKITEESLGSVYTHSSSSGSLSSSIRYNVSGSRSVTPSIHSDEDDASLVDGFISSPRNHYHKHTPAHAYNGSVASNASNKSSSLTRAKNQSKGDSAPHGVGPAVVPFPSRPSMDASRPSAAALAAPRSRVPSRNSSLFTASGLPPSSPGNRNSLKALHLGIPTTSHSPSNPNSPTSNPPSPSLFPLPPHHLSPPSSNQSSLPPSPSPSSSRGMNRSPVPSPSLHGNFLNPSTPPTPAGPSPRTASFYSAREGTVTPSAEMSSDEDSFKDASNDMHEMAALAAAMGDFDGSPDKEHRGSTLRMQRHKADGNSRHHFPLDSDTDPEAEEERNGPGRQFRALSFMGPKTRLISKAPWDEEGSNSSADLDSFPAKAGTKANKTNKGGPKSPVKQGSVTAPPMEASPSATSLSSSLNASPTLKVISNLPSDMSVSGSIPSIDTNLANKERMKRPHRGKTSPPTPDSAKSFLDFGDSKSKRIPFGSGKNHKRSPTNMTTSSTRSISSSGSGGLKQISLSRPSLSHSRSSPPPSPRASVMSSSSRKNRASTLSVASALSVNSAYSSSDPFPPPLPSPTTPSSPSPFRQTANDPPPSSPQPVRKLSTPVSVGASDPAVSKNARRPPGRKESAPATIALEEAAVAADVRAPSPSPSVKSSRSKTKDSMSASQTTSNSVTFDLITPPVNQGQGGSVSAPPTPSMQSGRKTSSGSDSKGRHGNVTPLQLSSPQKHLQFPDPPSPMSLQMPSSPSSPTGTSTSSGHTLTPHAMPPAVAPQGSGDRNSSRSAPANVTAFPAGGVPSNGAHANFPINPLTSQPLKRKGTDMSLDEAKADADGGGTLKLITLNEAQKREKVRRGADDDSGNLEEPFTSFAPNSETLPVTTALPPLPTRQLKQKKSGFLGKILGKGNSTPSTPQSTSTPASPTPPRPSMDARREPRLSTSSGNTSEGNFFDEPPPPLPLPVVRTPSLNKRPPPPALSFPQSNSPASTPSVERSEPILGGNDDSSSSSNFLSPTPTPTPSSPEMPALSLRPISMAFSAGFGDMLADELKSPSSPNNLASPGTSTFSSSATTTPTIPSNASISSSASSPASSMFSERGSVSTTPTPVTPAFSSAGKGGVGGMAMAAAADKIAELEALVRNLRAEVEDLKKENAESNQETVSSSSGGGGERTPCPHCGCSSSACEPRLVTTPTTTMLDRGRGIKKNRDGHSNSMFSGN